MLYLTFYYYVLCYKLLYLQYNLKRYIMDLRIKEILKEKKITAVSLADTVGLAQPSMSNIINSKVMPSVETLERIAIALNVPFSELFEQPKQNIITCPNCGTELELKKKE